MHVENRRLSASGVGRRDVLQLRGVRCTGVSRRAGAEVRSLDRLRESLGPIPSPPPAGPLMKLLAAGDELAASLSADPVVVFGTDKAARAIGRAAAKALLSKWRKLPLAIEEGDKVREVRTASWGFAMADMNILKLGGAPYRMTGLLIAVPGPSGSWSVVAVSYGAL